MKRAAVLSLVLLVGCKSAPEPTPEPAPEPARAKVAWSVPLQWNDGTPMIDARVRDGNTRFIISTSSTYHTLSKSFASEVRAPVSTGRQTSVVHGGSSEVERVEGVVSIQSADADWRLEKVVAAESAEMDQAGIGGFVVPQRLVTNTTTMVLDFRGGAITLVEGEPDLFRAWFQQNFGEAAIWNVQRDGDGLLFMEAEIGGQPGKVLLDSSIPTSRFLASKVGAEVPEGECVEKADPLSQCVPGVSTKVDGLKLGSHDFGGIQGVAVIDLPGGAAAAIGSDVLKKCAIAISPGNEVLSVCD